MADQPTYITIPRLKPTGPRFHHACQTEDNHSVHDWRFHDIYQDTGPEYVIWYCTRCREVRHDPNGAPSY